MLLTTAPSLIMAGPTQAQLIVRRPVVYTDGPERRIAPAGIAQLYGGRACSAGIGSSIVNKKEFPEFARRLCCVARLFYLFYFCMRNEFGPAAQYDGGGNKSAAHPAAAAALRQQTTLSSGRIKEA